MKNYDEIYHPRSYRPKGWKWQRLFCRFGLHIPVMQESDPIEYFCQNCAKTLTEADWKRFWREK